MPGLRGRGHNRGLGGSRTRGNHFRGRAGTRGAFHVPRRSKFNTSRLEDSEAEDNEIPEPVDEVEDDEVDDLSDEEAVNGQSAYQELLSVLRAKKDQKEPVRKKRKLTNGQPNGAHREPNHRKVDVGAAEPSENVSETPLEEEEEAVEESERDEPKEAADFDGDVDDDGETLEDPFQQHYGNVDETLLATRIEAIKSKKWESRDCTTSTGLRKTITRLAGDDTSFEAAKAKQVSKAGLKQRLQSTGAKFLDDLNEDDHDLSSAIMSYKDVLYGARTVSNSKTLRNISALHILNHILKTRDRVIKNNARLAQLNDTESLDLRDQGFTRPKVLVIVPTRQSCVKFVESIVHFSQPDQQGNKSRFLEAFSADEESAWDDKPEDFQELFDGNNDDMFRLGLKFTRKTIKYFSAFYNSDIILASPLGLKRAIESGGKDSKKAHDADFLSSIEILVMDHTNALLMQNWQHLSDILPQLNLLPKESHGCDFSRVRNYYLDGHAKHLRQTILISTFVTPQINTLITRHTSPISGRTKYHPTHHGTILSNTTTPFPHGLTQTFTRFTSPTALSDPDTRFSIFTSTLLPPLLAQHTPQKGTLIFIPSHADFLRLRNHLTFSTSTSSLSFASISEYTSARDVARTRSHFLSGRHAVLLYTERAHHFRRYALQGVKRVLLYGVPENPVFYEELVRFMADGNGGDVQRPSVRVLFSKYDFLALERVVGTERVGDLVFGRGGDTFEFT